eukprot:5913505-Alexandrium_andersonii.AAC.1
MAFIPTRDQAEEAILLREEALAEVLDIMGSPMAPSWAQPAALFPAEPAFWTLLGTGAGAANPYLEVVLRLRAVQGALVGPEELRGGSARDM